MRSGYNTSISTANGAKGGRSGEVSGVLQCSFCGSVNAEAVTTTSRAQLLADYRTMHGLSFPTQVLDSNFAFQAIATKRCRGCSTIFYDPMIAGDAAYYEYLSRNVSWYYSPKRWEYPIAADMLVKENPRLFLEVGCGAGHFLRLARDRGYEGHGCEMNPQHLETLRGEGFHIFTDPDHAVSQYDALFMFQVLEHLVDPYGYLKTLLPNVRPGGIIVLSTPVSPSCAGFAIPPFALPPHHQWMPSTRGFNLLAERLGLVCETIMCDPPDWSQISYGLRKRCGGSAGSKSIPLFWRIAGRATLRMATFMRREWARVGHTGMALLRKPALTN